MINNFNQVVDIFWHETNNWFFRNTRSKHVYIYDSGLVEDLGSPEQWGVQELEDWQTSGSWDSRELGVVSFNDDQQFLLSNSKQFDKATRFGIWQNREFKEIDPNIISVAYRMNNRGVILGRKWVQKGNIKVAMLVLYNPVDGSIVEITKDINLITRELNDQG